MKTVRILEEIWLYLFENFLYPILIRLKNTFISNIIPGFRTIIHLGIQGSVYLLKALWKLIMFVCKWLWNSIKLIWKLIHYNFCLIKYLLQIIL